VSSKTFIRIVEYWVPNANGSLLEFGGGLFGKAASFAAITRRLCFGRGEGLPGQAWDLGQPVMLKQFHGSYFQRIAAADDEGLTCGIALPTFIAGRLTAVTVFFCGDDDAHAGAIELWANQPKISKDMRLVEGYYGNTGDTFEFVSRSVGFRQGNGLPGLAWERNKPVFMDNLGKGSGFLRADSAVKVGINRGFAFPCASADGSNQVMAFLSALATPIARRVEIWEPDALGTRLQRTLGFTESEGQRDQSGASVDASAASGAIGAAFVTGLPQVDTPMFALPIAPHGQVTAVLALFF
jgi:hypothetical protein